MSSPEQQEKQKPTPLLSILGERGLVLTELMGMLAAHRSGLMVSYWGRTMYLGEDGLLWGGDNF